MNQDQPSEQTLKAAILKWLCLEDSHQLQRLFTLADRIRHQAVGDEVHLRGLIEISNHCACQCTYCGIRAGNSKVTRYRMSAEEIIASAEDAKRRGYGTVVMQGGEDWGIQADWLAEIIRTIKSQTGLAVTLSLGDRHPEELTLWREAGANRYLLRFETTDQTLFDRIHPHLVGQPRTRIKILQELKQIGYETGSGIMVGIPGQTYTSIVEDLLTFRRLDLDMIGIGPYLLHPETPMGSYPASFPTAENQVPSSQDMTLKVLALTRLLCPDANLPSTTALGTINQTHGRENGLRCGANVIMPNVTPSRYRRFYEIYPQKANLGETADQSDQKLAVLLPSLGRTVGSGLGCRQYQASQSIQAEAVQFLINQD